MPSERRVRGMPDALPAKNATAWLDFGPLWIEGMAAMTEPFRSELPDKTMGAALHQKPALAQSGPVRRRQTIGLGDRNWQPRRKIGSARLAAHSTASEPSSRLLTGVTIGPPITKATSLRLTWFFDVSRTGRAASSTSSRPCM